MNRAISDRLVDDTLCTALEGGCTYWAIRATPHGGPAAPTSRMFPGQPAYASELLTMGATLDIEPDPELVDDTVKAHNTLTLAAFKRGIRAWCELRHITPAALDDDPADAADADCILQLALFGEIIFG